MRVFDLFCSMSVPNKGFFLLGRRKIQCCGGNFIIVCKWIAEVKAYKNGVKRKTSFIYKKYDKFLNGFGIVA